MTARNRKPTVGLPRLQAGWISVAWFLFGVGAILVALPSLERDLRRKAELDMLSWMQAEGEALRPVVDQIGPHGLGEVLPWPVPLARASAPARYSRYAGQAQLWLVSASEEEPGFIIPVSTGSVSAGSLRDFALLQAGIAAARCSATRPLAWVGGPESRQVVAYLRLEGTRYSISSSMSEELVYGRVRPRLLTVAAVAATVLTCACAALFRLISVPAGAVAGPAVEAAAGSRPAAPELPEAVAQRLTACFQRILYHTDSLEHERQPDPRLHEHLTEIRETARQGLADLPAQTDRDGGPR
jgi:hypothetical protein